MLENEAFKKIEILRSELHKAISSCMDLTDNFVVEKSVELDNELNLYYRLLAKDNKQNNNL